MRIQSKRTIFAVVFVIIIAWLMTSNSFQKWLPFRKLWGDFHPKIEFPEFVEIGEIESGQLIDARFQLKNRGNKDLILKDFRSGCACDGLEYESDSGFVRFASLTVEPGKAVKVRLVQRARGLVGRTSKSFVAFLTNDPEKPEGLIEIRIKNITGGVSFSTNLIDTGPLRVGQKHEVLVEVFDKSGLGRSVQQVGSTIPGQVKVDFTPVSKIANIQPNQPEKELLGRLRISFETKIPGPIQGAAEIYISGQINEPGKILVKGRVAPMVEFAPSNVFLPRNSESGPLYKSNCIFQSPFGAPFALGVRHCPDNIQIAIDNTELATTHQVSISIKQSFLNEYSGIKKNFRIGLVAKVDGNEVDLSIPVTVQNVPGP